MRGERELHVRVGLAGLRIEVLRAPGPELARLLDDRVAQQGGERDDVPALGIDNGVALDAQVACRVQLRLRQLEDSFAHGLRRGPDRAAGDVGLARRGRRPRRSNPRICVQHHDVAHAKLASGYLRLHHDQALAHIGGGGVHLDSGPSVDDGQADPRRGVVVEAFRVADVLEADRVADPPLHSFAVGRVGDPSRHRRQISSTPLSLSLSPEGRGVWHCFHPAQQLGDRDRAIDDLARDQLASRLHRVAHAQLYRVHPKGRGELVHLGLVRVAVLHGAETAHRAAGWVVRVDDDAVDRRVGALIWADRKARGVRDHRGRARRVGAAVEKDASLHIDELSIAARAVLVGEAPGMSMHVTDERLGPRVRDLHRPAGLQGEHAGVGLHREIFTGAERSSDAGHRQPNPFHRNSQHDRELLLVDVKPLRREMQVDAALAVRDREARLRAERRLVLHADLVLASDHNLRMRRRLAVPDLHPARDVAVRVQLRRVR